MITRLSQDARHQVLPAAADEARSLGDRRIGTDHLLLGLLHDPVSMTERALGVTLQAAREARDRLDRVALAELGIDVIALDSPQVRTARRPPFTSGARAALHRAVARAQGERSRVIATRHLLQAVLDCSQPDPCAELLAELGVDLASTQAWLAHIER